MVPELEAVAEALRHVDAGLDACDDETLTEAVHRLAELQTTFHALWLRAVGLADQRSLHRAEGARDTATWIAALAGERRGTSRRDLELAVQLVDAPLIAEALAAGDVSKAKAVELVRATVLPEAAQQQLVGQARTLPVEQVAAAVERARLAHRTPEAPVTPALTVSRRSDRATVEATLDLVDAEVLDVALSTAVETLGLPTTVPYAERRARALTAIARFFLDNQHTVGTSRAGRPHVLVLVDLEVLEARTGGSATLASGTVVTGDQARRLAEDANISRVITKGRSEPLDVGRSTRSVPPAIAKAVITRDRHCRYEGCAAPAWACDVHHRQPWARGGPTAVHNMGLLCWFHHELVHRRGPEHLRLTADGRWTLPPAGVPVRSAA